ncbi:MAG: DNA phosphorothioation system sulfurtransferase DndC [Desulfobacteraceae bacterium]|nr:MAG: DNA phosphorothioation system sulfurtransferase DndC [Desulfobacteraceae bacterium]
MDGIIQKTKQLLLENYFIDRRPWVIAYSGGKDSTLVLQLVYEMLLDLKHSGRQFSKQLYVIASDTGVEPPNIQEYLLERLSKISNHAESIGLPLHVKLVKPTPENSFWGNLIGKGYPSPTRWFRWCTHKMKIKPSRYEIEKISDEHGSIVLLLGSRFSESNSRKHGMDKRLKNSRGLNPHNEIPDALVFAPIADWKTEEVWKFLSNNPAPWGESHDFLLDLYRQAGGSECLLALDLGTPSCGGSRFGCWTCTVIKEDKSMNGFIQSGEDWMLPLYDFRNWLKEIREDMKMRLPFRRNNGKGPGPFSPEARKLILQKLLEVEHKVGILLIKDEEISFIQQQWREDFDAIESAYSIVRRYGRKVKKMNIISISSEEEELLNKLIVEYEIEETCVKELLNLATKTYPSFDNYGSKENFKKDIKRVIEKAIQQEELVEFNK